MIEPLEYSGQAKAVAWNTLLQNLQVHHGIHPGFMPFGSFHVATGIDGGVDGLCRRSKGNRLWADLIRNGSFKTTYLNSGAIADFRQRSFWEVLPFNIQATNKNVRVHGFVFWFPTTSPSGNLWLAYKVEGYHDVSPGSPEDPFTRPFEYTQVRNTEVSGGAVYNMAERPSVATSGRFLYIVNPQGDVPNITLWFDWDRWVNGGNNGLANYGGWRSDYFGIPSPAVLRVVGLQEPYRHPGVNRVIGGTLYRKVPVTTVAEDESVHAIGQSPDGASVLLHLDISLTNLVTAPFILEVKRDDEAGWTDAIATNIAQRTDVVAGQYVKFEIGAQVGTRIMYYRFKDSAGTPNYYGYTNGSSGIPFRLKIGAGYAKRGRYRIAARLVDTNRNRYSNMIRMTNVYLPAGNDFALASTLTESGISGGIPQSTNQHMSFRIITDDTANSWGAVNEVANSAWTEFQAWCTQAGPAPEDDPGETFNLGDQMSCDNAWTTGVLSDGATSTEASICSHVRIMHKSLRAVGPGTELNPKNMPFTDQSLAGSDPISGKYNPNSHDYRVWGTSTSTVNPINPIHAIHSYQGITLAAILEGGAYKLIWSDGTQFAPENFPLGNIYELAYQTGDNLAFVEASDYIYLFGDGPVYQIRRDGIFLDVLKLDGSIPLASRNSAASTGNGIIAVAENGVFVLDGVSGSRVRLKSLDRLMRDRWSNRRLHKYIQVAYDAAQDAVHILCPGVAESVTLWLGADRITMQDGALFSFLRTLKTLDGARGWVDRSMWVNWLGKICYPVLTEESSNTYDNYTMHGLTDQYSQTAPGTWNAKVSGMSTTTVNGVSCTILTLTDAAGNAFTHTTNLLAGSTVLFLTGLRKGEIHQVWWSTSGSATQSVINVRGDITSLGSLVGSWVALSPVPMMLCSGPLPGDTGRQFHQRKHVLGTKFVVDRISGSDVNNLTGFNPVRCGVSDIPGFINMEPLPSPDIATDTASALLWLPDTGALSRWIRLSDASVRLTDSTLSALTVQANSLSPRDGVAGRILMPVWICEASGVVFDLLSLEWTGIIGATEKG